MTTAVSKKALKTFSLNDPSLLAVPTLVLEPLNDTFLVKKVDLFEPCKIGRKTSPKTGPETHNGIFDSKVLSRNHAEVMCQNGKVGVVYYYPIVLFLKLTIT